MTSSGSFPKGARCELYVGFSNLYPKGRLISLFNPDVAACYLRRISIYTSTGTLAPPAQAVHPDAACTKLGALVEGARLASQRLF
jgi:hypothetical protein